MNLFNEKLSNVEFLPLGEIAKIVRGERVTKSELIEDGKYPVISGGMTPMGFLDRCNRDGNAITIAQYGTAGYVDWQTNPFWANDVCYTVNPHSLIDEKYLYYVLKDRQRLIYSLKIDAIPAHLPQTILKEIKIPLPQIKIQERIVRILDKFTMLEAELEAELEARKKQYRCYRDKFFKTDEQVQIFKLKDVVQLTMGTSPRGDTVSDNPDGGIEFHQGKSYFGDSLIGNSGKYTTDPVKIAEPESVIMSVRAPVGDSNYTNRKIAIGRGLCAMQGKELLDTKYLYYFIDTSINKFKQQSTGSTFESINTRDIENIDIPVPSIEKQNYTVKMLDRFAKLAHDVSAGLPAEVKARKRQYEHYRSKLLTFELLTH